MQEVQALVDELLRAQQDKRLPPVASWQPKQQGEIDIRIASDGQWFHEGDVIARHELVVLFAGILRKDEQGYALVTPAERLAIQVEDVPFVAVDMQVGGSPDAPDLLFSTNVDDHVMASQEHPIILRKAAEEFTTDAGSPARPYVMIRDNLLASLSRPLYYRLIDHCLSLGAVSDDRLYAQSQGQKFDLGSLT